MIVEGFGHSAGYAAIIVLSYAAIVMLGILLLANLAIISARLAGRPTLADNITRRFLRFANLFRLADIRPKGPHLR